MICERCGASPTIYARPRKIDIAHRRYFAQHLCAKCFCTWVEVQFSRTVENEQLVRADDHVLVALSGGKDSQLMVTLLASYRGVCRFDWIAVLVDEGITGYRAIGLELARATAQQLGLRHITISYAQAYGLTLDEMVEKGEQSGAFDGVRQRVCALCGSQRMRLMLHVGHHLGCNVLASGRNLDDFVADTLLYMCTPHGLAWLNAFRGAVPSQQGGIRIVNPLWKLTDKEIALYCRLNEIPYQLEPECPYSSSMLGDVMRGQVHAVEEVIPGFRHAFAKGIERLQLYLNGSLRTRPPLICPSCGRTYSPDSAGECCPTCQFHKLVESLGGHVAHLSDIIT